MNLSLRLVLFATGLSLFSSSAVLAASAEIANFALIDQRGKLHELRRMQGSAVVLFFTMNGCPVARQSASKL
jgi:peroxiredoxin